jgi:hypothetical protein
MEGGRIFRAINRSTKLGCEVAMSKSQVCLLLVFAWGLPNAACAQQQPQPVPTVETGGNENSQAQTARAEGQRIAVLDIPGCSRDQTTFYKGKVLAFKRTSKATAITVRTEWDTTEKLTQSNVKPIEFRLHERQITPSEWAQMQSALTRQSGDVRATVWVCKVKNKDTIKIIEWNLTSP